ncbi:hypothetical protein DPMN_175558 [Dreissena polymorpha]|uniref:Uncharacterized protein n=1 Tax=Dreissena polymorpha TaxID=45954 RepID=A0A9D4IIC7_DREPO|nr:hypothetical protein DPMN_175558 [Dreissena polymorpha]
MIFNIQQGARGKEALFAHLRGTNILFHDDWANNKTAPGSHVIQLTGTIFELNSYIKETNVLTKFHENWAKNVTSRVSTCFHYIQIEKNAPPTGGHVFSPIWTIFKLVRDINKTNVLTNFPDDWAKIETSRVFTRKTAPRQPCFSTDRNHFRTQLSYQGNKSKNVTSRVFTCFHYMHIEKNAPPTGGHVFSPIWTIFKLVRDINKINVLPNFHDDWAKIVRKLPPPPGSHVSQLTGTIFKLNSHIKETNVLTKFHSQIRKTAPPTGGHVFQRAGTTFELDQHIIKANILTNFELYRDIIGTNLLTKFHEDRTGNVASRVFTNQMCRTDERTDKDRSQKLTWAIR